MKRFLTAARLILTLKCEDSTHIVSDSLDRDLSAVERWAVRLHYISCWSCRRFGQQIRGVREALRSTTQQSGDARLSSDALRRIEEAIQREQ